VEPGPRAGTRAGLKQALVTGSKSAPEAFDNMPKGGIPGDIPPAAPGMAPRDRLPGLPDTRKPHDTVSNLLSGNRLHAQHHQHGYASRVLPSCCALFFPLPLSSAFRTLRFIVEPVR